MSRKKPSEVRGNFWQILYTCQSLVFDYEKLQKDIETQKKFRFIDTAYIDSIIIHLAKLLSNGSRNEPFCLGEFKKVCNDKVLTELEQIEHNHKDIIGKIKTNRDKLIAHLDDNFYNLAFSEQEIERMVQEQITFFDMEEHEARRIYASMPKSVEKTKERYSVLDFRNDLSEIREMLTELDSAWKRSLPLKNVTN